MKFVLFLFLAGIAFASDKDELAKANAQIKLMQLEIDRLNARDAWCAQELTIWQNPAVMQTRLNLQLTDQKKKEADAAAKEKK